MDWKKLAFELIKKGLSQVEIGRELGRSQAWVSALLKGSYTDIPWATGEKLRALHAQRVGDSLSGNDESAGQSDEIREAA